MGGYIHAKRHVPQLKHEIEVLERGLLDKREQLASAERAIKEFEAEPLTAEMVFHIADCLSRHRQQFGS